MIDLPEETDPGTGSVESETRPGNPHTLRWTEWGEDDNRDLVICAHGLSRNARDFDFLARRLGTRYRVICPDYPGRGASDWLVNPAYYNNEQYLADTQRLLAALDFERLTWIGTSMGGLIGMALAAESPGLIERMVINDVGAFIPGEALRVIADYLGEDPRFASEDEAMEYYRTVYAGFGPLEDSHYRHFVRYGIIPARDGEGFVLGYDPAIIDQFASGTLGDVELWELWDRVTCPVLLLRGQESGLLLPQTVEQMKHRHGATQAVEIPDCAHAPSLMVEDQIELIARWLDS